MPSEPQLNKDPYSVIEHSKNNIKDDLPKVVNLIRKRKLDENDRKHSEESPQKKCNLISIEENDEVRDKGKTLRTRMKRKDIVIEEEDEISNTPKNIKHRTHSQLSDIITTKAIPTCDKPLFPLFTSSNLKSKDLPKELCNVPVPPQKPSRTKADLKMHSNKKNKDTNFVGNNPVKPLKRLGKTKPSSKINKSSSISKNNLLKYFSFKSRTNCSEVLKGDVPIIYSVVDNASQEEVKHVLQVK
jgi:hypothetical protein